MADAVGRARADCAKSGYHEHDGCTCSDAELLSVQWQAVPKRIDYRARLAFETIIGTKLDAELGQRLWDAMLANSPAPSAAGPQDISTAPQDVPILVWYPDFGWMRPGHAEWWTWERKPTHWMPEPPPPRKPEAP